MIRNAMTVDVEDYFQVSAFESVVRSDQWDSFPSRIERNTLRILELFEQHETVGTFFILGWIAERFPQLVREIADAGHEVASHGLAHVRATKQNREEFLFDVSRSRNLLEDISSQSVKGYRAASFSIGSGNLWALEALQESGYVYSSSIGHDHYGMPDAPRFAFRNGEGGLLEVPITTVSVLRRNLPCGGGGYFRLLPYWYSKWAFNRVNQTDRRSGVFYFHPWELDPDQPKQAGINFRTRIRHYTNLGKMEYRLTRFLKEFSWDRMDNVFLNGHSTDVECAEDTP